MSKRLQTDPDLARWCAALAAPIIEERVPPGWFTTKQLAEKLKKPRPTIQRQIYAAVEAGKCEVRSFRVNVGSFSRATPHYRLK